MAGKTQRTVITQHAARLRPVLVQYINAFNISPKDGREMVATALELIIRDCLLAADQEIGLDVTDLVERALDRFDKAKAEAPE